MAKFRKLLDMTWKAIEKNFHEWESHQKSHKWNVFSFSNIGNIEWEFAYSHFNYHVWDLNIFSRDPFSLRHNRKGLLAKRGLVTW